MARAGPGGGRQCTREPYYLGILRGMCSGPYRGGVGLVRAVAWPASLGPGSGREVGGWVPEESRAWRPVGRCPGARRWGPAGVNLLRGSRRGECPRRLCPAGQPRSRRSRSRRFQPADFGPSSDALLLHSCLHKSISVS